MKSLPVFIRRWLVLISFSLPFTTSTFGNEMYFPSKSDIACRMVEDLPCDGAFIRIIATACSHQWQGENLRSEEGQERLPQSSTKASTSITAVTSSSTTALAPSYVAVEDTFSGKPSQQVSPHSITESLTPTTTLAAKGPRKSVRPSHGIVCKRNHDCRIRKSRCYREVCLCKPGFYFSPKQKACLRVCEEYGDGMDIYKGASIKDHNDKILYNTALSSCLDFCVRQKDFTCLTVDWSTDGICKLSRSGYRDVSFFDREKDLHDYSLGQRRCK